MTLTRADVPAGRGRQTAILASEFPEDEPEMRGIFVVENWLAEFTD